MDDHKRQFQDMKECLRRFDDTLCQKAGKSDMRVLEENFKQTYINNICWDEFMITF